MSPTYTEIPSEFSSITTEMTPNLLVCAWLYCAEVFPCIFSSGIWKENGQERRLYSPLDSEAGEGIRDGTEPEPEPEPSVYTMDNASLEPLPFAHVYIFLSFFPCSSRAHPQLARLGNHQDHHIMTKISSFTRPSTLQTTSTSLGKLPSRCRKIGDVLLAETTRTGS